jgi:hypothetical protein
MIHQYDRIASQLEATAKNAINRLFYLKGKIESETLDNEEKETTALTVNASIKSEALQLKEDLGRVILDLEKLMAKPKKQIASTQ